MLQDEYPEHIWKFNSESFQFIYLTGALKDPADTRFGICWLWPR